jgi:hypothetical protein
MVGPFTHAGTKQNLLAEGTGGGASPERISPSGKEEARQEEAGRHIDSHADSQAGPSQIIILA